MAEGQNQNESEQYVTATIDGQEVSVPKGTNIIKAAKKLGIEVPFYCYHPHLSVPGNCRICQVEVEGAPKLMIGCHTQVTEGDGREDASDERTRSSDPGFYYGAPPH
jgi:NADH dehydrogenase/NADH:ubiquinone oxidoreductase subunit G